MIFASLLLILVAIVLAVLGVVQSSDPLLVGSILASLLTAVTLAVSARQAAAARLIAGQGGLVVPFIPIRRGRRGRQAAEDAPAADEPVRDAPTGTVYNGRAPEPDEPSGGPSDEPAAGSGPEPAAAEATAALVEPVAEPEAPAEPAVREAPAVPPPAPFPSRDGPEDRDNQRLVPTQRDTGPDDEPLPGSVLNRFAGPDPLEQPTLLELDLRPDPVAYRAESEPTPGPSVGDNGAGTDEDPIDEPPAQLVPPADAALVAGLDTHVIVVDGRPRYHLASCVHLLDRDVEALPVSEAIELGFTPCSLCEPDTPLLAQARRA